MMDRPMRKALEQFLLDIDGPTELGTRRHDVGERQATSASTMAKAPSKRTPIEKLMQRREALIEFHPWQTSIVFFVIVALAILGVLAAFRSGTAAAIGVAIGSAMAVLFRLLQEIQRIQFRRMLFAMIQLEMKRKSIPIEKLVRLLLESDQFKFDKDLPSSPEEKK